MANYFTTDADLKEYEPDIHKYGIQDYDKDPNLHEKSYDDIIRLLNVEWWPTAGFGKYDVKILGDHNKLSPSRLIASQFKRASVYHVLAYYIYPRLSTFDPDGDVFREKMVFYKEGFQIEFDLILREGVKYDIHSSGTIEDSEQQPTHFNRLIR